MKKFQRFATSVATVSMVVILLAFAGCKAGDTGEWNGSQYYFEPRPIGDGTVVTLTWQVNRENGWGTPRLAPDISWEPSNALMPNVEPQHLTELTGWRAYSLINNQRTCLTIPVEAPDDARFYRGPDLPMNCTFTAEIAPSYWSDNGFGNWWLKFSLLPSGEMEIVRIISSAPPTVPRINWDINVGNWMTVPEKNALQKGLKIRENWPTSYIWDQEIRFNQGQPATLPEDGEEVLVYTLKISTEIMSKQVPNDSCVLLAAVMGPSVRSMETGLLPSAISPAEVLVSNWSPKYIGPAPEGVAPARFDLLAQHQEGQEVFAQFLMGEKMNFLRLPLGATREKIPVSRPTISPSGKIMTTWGKNKNLRE